jgi:ABC-2 type transport system permease protein
MKTNNGLLHIIKEGIYDTCYIWKEETKRLVTDEGVLLFCLVMPFVYPLLYSWIYNNEVVREVPTAVVDFSKSSQSREFIRKCDASPDVRIAAYANSLADAQQLVHQQKVDGIYVIPSDFSTRINRLEQSTIAVYTDMSIMLNYKAIYQTAVAVTGVMGNEIKIALAGNTTDRQDEITTAPLKVDGVSIFNPAGGYGSFIIPAVLLLIIQQLMLMGIGMSAGTAREENRYHNLVPMHPAYQGVFRIVLGKGACYYLVFAVWAAYLTIIIPRLFSFPALAMPRELLGLMIPYLAACVSFGLVISCMIRYRENVMLLIIFMSIPLLFMSGISWPLSNIPGVWQSVAYLFPSTFGIRAFVRINSMGASLEDVTYEYHMLWLQTAVYIIVACAVYRHQIILARNSARERIEYIHRKMAIRKKLKDRRIRMNSL